MKKVLIGLFIAIFIVSAAIFGYIYYKSHQKVEDVPQNKPELVEAIDAYGYKLEDRDTALFKEVFEELKTTLKEEKIDYSLYAKLLSELYIIDFYTISNKVSKYDVGGGDYVHPDYRDNFELKARDTIYKYVEDNSYNTRNQDLPEVKSITETEVTDSEYTLNEKKYASYKVSIKWDYTSENEYDTEAILFLIKYENKLYVVEQKAQK